MHRDPRYFAGNVPPTDPYEVGGYTYNVALGGHYASGVAVAPAFGAALAERKYGIPDPLNGFQLQPSETCPKNYIIFDRTDNTNQVMFHPALPYNFGSSNFHTCAARVEEYDKSMGRNSDVKEKCSSTFKEDTEEINALLSSEDENDEDDDVVSTGRTPDDIWEGNSFDPYLSMEDLGCATSGNASTYKSTSNCADSSNSKRDRMKRMVEALRGIIPGGDQLDTTLVLDEAVRYLKYLKVEVEKLGIENLDD